MVSMITPLLALVTTMLEQLLNNGKYQFKDTRLMKSLMVLHTVMCSAPMTGQLSSLAHQVWEDSRKGFLGIGYEIKILFLKLSKLYGSL